MQHRKVIQDYYSDINNLSELLNKLVNSYRLLIGGAGELNNIALASRGDVKDAIRRSTELGELIDDVIEVLEETSCCYLEYCKLKTQVISHKNTIAYIQTEIDKELYLDNLEK